MRCSERLGRVVVGIRRACRAVAELGSLDIWLIVMEKAGKIERWQTAVSDAKSLAMVSLLDNGQLFITVQDLRDPERRRFRFTFKNYPTYRSMLEVYQSNFWEGFNNEGTDSGWTRIIRESRWLAWLQETDPYLEESNPGLLHYMICTEDDVIEVLSNEVPEVIEVEPAAEDEKLPGKSTVYYDPEDREKIEELLNQIMRSSSDDV